MIAEFNHAAHDLCRRATTQKLRTQHAAPQDDLNPVVQRVAMIKHHFRCATAPQHAMNLADRARGIRRVMKDTVRVDHVKTLITKRQVLAVRDHKSAVSAVEPETMARDLDRSR